HDPRRPLTCRLILADAVPLEGNAGGCGSERKVKQCATAEHGAAHQTIGVAAVPVGVEHGLQQSPAGEANQTRGERPKKISAVRLLKRELQCVLRALRTPPEAA